VDEVDKLFEKYRDRMGSAWEKLFYKYGVSLWDMRSSESYGLSGDLDVI
jgi:hypothetical protein